MVPERLSQLLTAYVDGELSARQHRAVQRLLHKSSEARDLLRQLQADAQAVRRLPRRRLGQDLAPQVLRAIGERPVPAVRRAARAAGPAFPVWVGYAAAASVLLLVFSTSYFYFYLTTHPAPGDGADTPAVAQND